MKAIIGILLSALSLLVSVVVLKQGWNWFVAPLGVMNLTLIHALGISFLLSTATNFAPLLYIQRIAGKVGASDGNDAWTDALLSICVRLFLLLFMYLTSQQM